MGDVVRWPGITKLNLPAETVLQKAQEADLDEVVIVGFAKDGSEYFASTHADAAIVIYHLRRAEHSLMKIIDETSNS